MVRLAEIASAAGCSIAAVSKVLNPQSANSIRISDTTRKKIIQSARRLGYRPNRNAEFLKRGGIPEIAIFLPGFNNNLVLDIIKGSSKAASDAAFSLSYFFDLSQECFASFLEQATGRRNCGAIIYPRFDISEGTVKLLQDYRDSGGKLVFIEPQGPRIISPIPDLTRIFVDDRDGGEQVANHLLEQQCTTFVIYGDSRTRVSSFLNTVEKAGFPFRHFPQATDPDEVLDAITASAGTIGVFCTFDSLAINIHNGLLRRGEVPGERIKLCGYDRLFGIEKLSPKLSSVHQPFFRVGQMAVNMLIDLIYGRPVENITLKPELCPKESTLGKMQTSAAAGFRIEPLS